MATHSSVLAWRIPGMGESGGLPSMGSHRVRHNWSNLAAAAAGTKQFGSKFSPSFKYKIRKSEKILCLYPGIKKKKKAFCLNLCCSVAQSWPTLCGPTDCSTPAFSVLHHLPEPAQTHVHWVSDAIQPSHPVIPFSSRLQSFPASGSFFQWVSSSNQVAKVLALQLQHQSFQWIFRIDFL